MNTKDIHPHILELMDRFACAYKKDDFHYPAAADGTECVVRVGGVVDGTKIIAADGSVLSFGTDRADVSLAKRVASEIANGMVKVEHWRSERRWSLYR